MNSLTKTILAGPDGKVDKRIKTRLEQIWCAHCNGMRIHTLARSKVSEGRCVWCDNWNGRTGK